MASLFGLLRKTLKRSTNLVRRVGKVSRNTVRNTARRTTNFIGITRKSRKSRKSRGRKH